MWRCRVAPETLTQYQAHVKRLKDTLAQPNEAAFARENSHTDSADAAGVVGRVQAELVGEAASHAQNNASAAPVPHRPLLQPAVPNSTRADGSGAAEASGPAVLRQRGQRPPQDTALSKAAQAKLQMHENLQAPSCEVRQPPKIQGHSVRHAPDASCFLHRDPAVNCEEQLQRSLGGENNKL
ncbi:SNAP receptor use1, variant 2 [Trebouxia sp. C0010 RCD-2024]